MIPRGYDAGSGMLRWLTRTPVQTFVLCPLAVIVVELALHGGKLVFVPWGCVLLAWGYLQYLLVGNYRLPLAGGGRGMEVPPERIIATGPYRYTRNPMYLGHLVFMMGLAVTFCRGSRSSCSAPAPSGFTAACCTTSGVSKRASARITSPTKGRLAVGYPDFFDRRASRGCALDRRKFCGARR
jgi:hypothetical protein